MAQNKLISRILEPLAMQAAIVVSGVSEKCRGYLAVSLQSYIVSPSVAYVPDKRIADISISRQLGQVGIRVPENFGQQLDFVAVKIFLSVHFKVSPVKCRRYVDTLGSFRQYGTTHTHQRGAKWPS